MENNKKYKRKSAKAKNRFTICCFCLGSSTSDIDLNVPFTNNESYDYVVEKLAIKKVPITLFATDEDLAEIEHINCSNRASGITGDYKITPKAKKSAAIFSTYYSKIPKSNKNAESNNEKKPNEKFTKNLGEKDLKIMDVKAKPQNNVNFDKSSNIKEKQIITAEVYNENVEAKRDLKLTPKLQETINELGSKPRPEGSPGIIHHARIRGGTTDTQAIKAVITEQQNANDNSTPNISVKLNEIDNTKQDDSINQKILNEIFSPKAEYARTNENKASKTEITKTHTEENKLNSFFDNLGTKGGPGQKWKIIIKEHGDLNDNADRMAYSSSSDYSTGTETVSETE